MEFIVIDSDYFSDISTDSLIEEVMRQDANQFAFTFNDSDSYETIGRVNNHPFREFYIRSENREVLFLYSKNTGPWYTNVELFQLNQDSIKMLTPVFGAQALEACYQGETVVSNLHFYKGRELVAGLNCRDDFFSFNDPSDQLLAKLKEKGIRYQHK